MKAEDNNTKRKKVPDDMLNIISILGLKEQ